MPGRAYRRRFKVAGKVKPAQYRNILPFLSGQEIRELLKARVSMTDRFSKILNCESQQRHTLSK
jgi:hypothetical protein